MSDIRKSNDYEEIESTLTVARDLLLEKVDTFVGKIADELIVHRKKLLNNYVKKQYYSAFTKYAWMAICFSSKRDDLLQWINYGDRTKGFCIGFDSDYLKRYEEKRSKNQVDYLKLAKVRYVHRPCEEQKLSDLRQQFIEQSQAELIEQLRKVFDNPKERNFTMRSPAFIQEYFENHLLQFAFFKNDGFTSENEVRLCYLRSLILQDIQNTSEKSHLHTLSFNVRNGALIAHISLPIDIKAIKEVIIGANNRTDVYDLKRYLCKQFCDTDDGFLVKDIKVSRSSITFIAT